MGKKYPVMEYVRSSRDWHVGPGGIKGPDQVWIAVEDARGEIVGDFALSDPHPDLVEQWVRAMGFVNATEIAEGKLEEETHG